MTTELKIKDFLLHYLKKEYIKRSKIIRSIVSHVENLHTDNIITNKDRSRYLKTINEIVKTLNISYNLRIESIRGPQNTTGDDDNFDIEDDSKEKNDKEKNDKEKNDTVETVSVVKNLDKNLFEVVGLSRQKNMSDDAKIGVLDNIYDLCNTMYNTELKPYCPNDFEKSDVKLKELIGFVGCKNINDILDIYSNGVGIAESDKSIVEILNNNFIPLYVIQSIKSSSDKSVKVSKSAVTAEKYDILLGNFYKVEIGSKQITVYGYFEIDCVNSVMRTSQLCNKHINDKKKFFSDLIKGDVKTTKVVSTKLNNIPISFKQMYVKYLSLGDVLSYDANGFATAISSDYASFQKYSSSGNFKIIFDEFIHADLLVKFKIIKFLLLSGNTSHAGMLYGITKESKSGSVIIADIIYKNLNLQMQMKLQKANMSIKTEIEKLGNLDSDDVDLKKQIMLNKNMPLKVKKLALEKINEMKSGNSEYYKQLLYVKTLVDYPWVSESNGDEGDIFAMYRGDMNKWKEIMNSTKEKLNASIYGHKECKETMVELLGKWFSNPKALGKAIGLVGPPGVGKTLIAQQLGNALGIPYTKINLGGLEDASVLAGHSITYSGATCGIIVKKMTEVGKPRCIMFFDELDKTSWRHGRNEVMDVLIHVTDSTTNSEFMDKFFSEVTFPLNKVLFIFSFNDRSKVDPILLDRMELIKVDNYSIEDKINIVNNFLLKEVKNDIGMKINIKISNENIVYLVENFTNEAGVRNIKRKLEKLVLKINKDMIFKTGPFSKSKEVKTLEITKDMIDNYLTKPTILHKKIHNAPMIANVNGMYATNSGEGGILPICIYPRHMGTSGKFSLKLTGNLKKVMTESIEISFTIAINLVKSQYKTAFFKKYKCGLHIHTPDGGVPKDGPSGGSAFSLAFLSRILDKPIKHDIALTGEIEGNGDITAIGGLPYKLAGAKRAGVKLAFVPKENTQDIDKLKESNKTLFDDNFRVILVGHLREVIDIALIENDNDGDDDITYEKTFDSTKYLVNDDIDSTSIDNHSTENSESTTNDESPDDSEIDESSESVESIESVESE